MNEQERALLVDIQQELEPFIEREIEMDKKTILQRCAGAVSLRLLTVLKLLVFYRIGRDHEGQIYLV